MTPLEFEKPILELEGQIAELQRSDVATNGLDLSDEINKLQAKCDKLMADTYSRLTPLAKNPGGSPPRTPARNRLYQQHFR